MGTTVNLQAPWVTYCEQIKAIFKQDPQVNVECVNNFTEINIRVDDCDKADALTQLLPSEKEFGNIKVTINIVPGNETSLSSLIAKAFAGNPIFSKVVNMDEQYPLIGGNTYCVFNPEIIQFYNDDLSDLYGNFNGVVADVAKEVFESKDGLFFCTEQIEQ